MPRKNSPLLLRVLPLFAALALTGCLEQVPGMGPPPKVAAKQKEDKAIGSACRYAVRSIEDCYVLNPKASKNDVFAGWKEMDAYMRENKIEGVPSVLTPAPAQTAAPTESAAEE
ncbi:MAG: hypothetical protein KUL80_07405 [Comamonas sp.]|nr:hypothetical protein [Comamonas sp.]